MRKNLGSTSLMLTADDKAWQQGLDRATKKFNQFKKQTENDAKQLKASVDGSFNFGGLLAKGGLIGGAIGGGLAGFGLASLVTDSIKLAAEVEDTAASFKVMVGDAEKAKKLFAEIRDFAAKTPLTTRDLSAAGQTLLGFGTGADQIVPTLRVLGDLAQGDNEKLKGLAVVYGQVRAAGKLNGQDFNQFINQGVALGAELAKVLNVSESEVKSLMEAGRIGFPDLQRAMAGMTSEGGKFFGLMDERSKTLSGLLSSLKDNWEQLLGGFGQILIEEFGLKDFVDKLTKITDGGKDNLELIRPIVRDIADTFKDAAKHAYDMGKNFAISAAKVIDALDKIDARVGSITNNATTPDKANWLERNMTIGGIADNFVENSWLTRNASWLGPGGGAWAQRQAFGPNADGNGKVEKGARDAFGFLDEIFSDAKAMKGLAEVDGKKIGKDIARAFSIDAAKLTADQIKAARDIREDMDPFAKAKREIEDLQKIRELGGFNINDVKHWDVLQGKAIADKRGAEAFQFGVGRALKRAMGDLSAPWLDASSGIATKGSKEAIEMSIRNKNADLVKPENRIEAAINEGNRLQAEEKELMRQLFELWKDRKIPGFF